MSEWVNARYLTAFVLDRIDRVPHLSLYHFATDGESLPKIIQSLNLLTRSQECFEISAIGYDTTNLPWLGVLYERDEALLKLHQNVLEIVAPFRERKNYDQMEEWSDISPERQENLELYGWSEARSLYRPHITITRFQQAVGEAVIDTLPMPAFSFYGTALALYELGEYGTCHNLIAQLHFEQEVL